MGKHKDKYVRVHMTPQSLSTIMVPTEGMIFVFELFLIFINSESIFIFQGRGRGRRRH